MGDDSPQTAICCLLERGACSSGVRCVVLWTDGGLIRVHNDALMQTTVDVPLIQTSICQTTMTIGL
jgi:hypothetical protein